MPFAAYKSLHIFGAFLLFTSLGGLRARLAIAADTPASVYPLILGVYTLTEEGGFQRLQLVTGDGRITQDDILNLTKIRVD